MFVREVLHRLIDAGLSAGLIDGRSTRLDPVDFGGHCKAGLGE